MASEAPANVAEHARASRASIAVEHPAAGSGLAGSADRVAALDGTLRVESPPGRGTRVRAELPAG